MPHAPLDPKRRCLKIAEWPEQDRRLWEAGLRVSDDLFDEASYSGSRNPHTLSKIEEGYSRFLGALIVLGMFIADAAPATRVRPATIKAFIRLMQETGNRPHTIMGRLTELRLALQIMVPRTDFSWITNPNGRSFRSTMTMTRLEHERLNSKEEYKYGCSLMSKALALTPARRRVQLRDGLMIAILACRAPRLRSLTEMMLGRNVVRTASGYRLIFYGDNMKCGARLEYDAPPGLTWFISRYLEVERQELLKDAKHDAFWVNWNGKPLGEAGIEKRIRWLSAKRFAKAFGPHRYRHTLVTSQVLADPNNPGIGSAILGITPDVAQEHYNLADQAQAAVAFHKVIADDRRDSEGLAQRAFDLGDIDSR